MVGRYCRLEPVNVQRHEKDLFSAYQQAPDDRDWTYLFPRSARDTPQDFNTYLDKLEKSEDPLHFTIIDASLPTKRSALQR